MTSLLLLGVVCIAVAVVLIVRTVALPRMRMATHLRQIDTYGYSGASPQAQAVRPPLGETINAVAETVGRTAQRVAPTLRPLPSRELSSAGYYTISSEAFHGYRIAFSAVLPVLIALEIAASGGSAVIVILLLVLFAAGGWLLFGSFVRTRSERRLHEIDRELPELIDVLIATLEAGLGFAGSLQIVAARFEGPLGNELKLALQEQTMGLSSTQALNNILERSDTQAMRAFVRAVIQGETLGVSIGTMMRNLAVEMRTRRRQGAEERVQKAPLKMLFPLIFLIFPSMLIVLLYPAVHELLNGFSKL